MQLTWMNQILFAEASSGLNVRMTHIGSMAANPWSSLNELHDVVT